MKKLPPIMAILFVTSCLSGCFIQSFQPFYTDDLVTDHPGIKGKWSLVRKGDEEVAQKYPQPWVFTDDEITTFEHSISSILDVTYFTIGESTFVDLTPAEPDEDKGPNEWWTIHTIPVHSVCKVVMSADALSLTPLDGEWVAKLLEKRRLPCPSRRLTPTKELLRHVRSVVQCLAFALSVVDTRLDFWRCRAS